MKTIEFSQKVHKKLQLIRQTDKKLYQKIIKQLALFQENSRHTSLRLHKIKRGKDNAWSISIDEGYRMLYIENNSIYFFEMGTHDEVYRKR